MIRAKNKCNVCLRYFKPEVTVTVCDRCWDKIWDDVHIIKGK